MALEATHIKFALDIKDKYDIQDLSKYLSGTIYPDSRYITKIDRKLSHNDSVLLQKFMDNDFKKGWSVHFLCDKLQSKAMDKILPNLLDIESPKSFGTPWWVNVSAIKNIADIEIFKQFDIQPYLPMLDYVENPHDESLEQVRKYNQFIQKLYKNKKEIRLDDLKQMWAGLGIGAEMAEKVINKTKEFMEDDILVEKINNLYNEMLSQV